MYSKCLMIPGPGESYEDVQIVTRRINMPRNSCPRCNLEEDILVIAFPDESGVVKPKDIILRHSHCGHIWTADEWEGEEGDKIVAAIVDVVHGIQLH